MMWVARVWLRGDWTQAQIAEWRELPDHRKGAKPVMPGNVYGALSSDDDRDTWSPAWMFVLDRMVVENNRLVGAKKGYCKYCNHPAIIWRRCYDCAHTLLMKWWVGSMGTLMVVALVLAAITLALLAMGWVQ